jgi:hypothetical protein
MRALTLVAACLTLTWSPEVRGGPTSETPAPTKPALDLDDPASCGACHAAILAEYQTSLHAASHHGSDPIYAAVRRLRLRKEGPTLASACASCHTPRDVGEVDSARARTGVSCAACHHVERVERGERGHRALVRPTGPRLAGPHDLEPGRSPAHETGKAPGFMTDGTTLCLACHRDLESATGVSICSTGIEHAPAEGSCVDCHMPMVSAAAGEDGRRRRRSHAFVGPRARTGRPVLTPVRLDLRREGDALVVTLTNQSGHAWPTGFPGRVGRLTVTSPTNPPFTQSFGKRYVDAAGQPTLAPYARALAEDTRLRAGERRRLTLPWTADPVEARLELLPVAPSLAESLGLEGPEVAPRPLAAAALGATRTGR